MSVAMVGAVVGGAGGLLGLQHGQAGAVEVAVQLAKVGRRERAAQPGRRSSSSAGGRSASS